MGFHLVRMEGRGQWPMRGAVTGNAELDRHLGDRCDCVPEIGEGDSWVPAAETQELVCTREQKRMPGPRFCPCLVAGGAERLLEAFPKSLSFPPVGMSYFNARMLMLVEMKPAHQCKMRSYFMCELDLALNVPKSFGSF